MYKRKQMLYNNLTSIWNLFASPTRTFPANRYFTHSYFNFQFSIFTFLFTLYSLLIRYGARSLMAMVKDGMPSA